MTTGAVFDIARQNTGQVATRRRQGQIQLLQQQQTFAEARRIENARLISRCCSSTLNPTYRRRDLESKALPPMSESGSAKHNLHCAAPKQPMAGADVTAATASQPWLSTPDISGRIRALAITATRSRGGSLPNGCS
jgi:hypothetical protein